MNQSTASTETHSTTDRDTQADPLPDQRITELEESPNFNRYNHPNISTVKAVFKFSPKDSQLVDLGAHQPQYHIITTSPDQPTIVVQPIGNCCSACENNQTYTPKERIPLTQMEIQAEASNCIHANIAETALRLGNEDSQSATKGEPCNNCGAWGFDIETVTKTVRGGQNKMTFKTHTCSECEAKRHPKQASNPLSK
jgi:hypothetical protein